MAKLFDSHAHYYDARYAASGTDPEELLRDLFAGTVGNILNVGTCIENAPVVIAQAGRHERMYAAVGIHPTDGQTYEDPVAAVAELEKILGTPETRKKQKIVAVGEIGLDYHYPDTDRPKQMLLLDAQMELAKEKALPVIIHDRDAHGDIFEAVLRHKGVTGVFHSYSGSPEMATELLRRGWFLSFSGVATFRNVPRVREAVAATPLDRLLIETDCPYLAPVPHRGELNHSGYLSFTAEAVAAIKKITLNELIAATAENACRIFGISC